MLDWQEYRKELLARIGDIAKLSPDTVRGYRTLSDAGKQTNHLDARTRELIALAVAVTSRCDGCITMHTPRSRRARRARRSPRRSASRSRSMRARRWSTRHARSMRSTPTEQPEPWMRTA